MRTPTRPDDQFLVFGSPDVREEEIREVEACLRSGWLGTGPRVARFEEAFRVYNEAAHAVAVNSCTAALHLCALAAGIEPGSEVITTPLTFCATVNALIHAGLVPVLADVDPVTMNIDPRAIEERITPRTRAIMPVHFAGRPCEMGAIIEIAQHHDLFIIEDCAHAIEARYRDQPCGTFGDFGCFSFYVTKNLTTGEGGMVLAKDEAHAAAIKRLALHGMSKDAWKRFSDDGFKHYQVVECGFKCNMMDLQAALGLHQLARLEDNLKKREAVWQRYCNAFATLPLRLPPSPAAATRHARHLFTLLIEHGHAPVSRDEFMAAMTAENIGVGVHYMSIPEHPFYQQTFGWQPEDFPNAMHIGRSTVSLPLASNLSDKDVEDVITAVQKTMQ